jgi:hypothetical protein
MQKRMFIVAGAALVLGLLLVMMGVGYNNKEIDLRNQAAAQQLANEAQFDEVWKVIKQVANVTDKYAADFRGIYNDIMAGRYAADGENNPMFKWISEQNPTLDSAMYIKLADTINAQRAGFTRVQKRLIDIKREHDNLRKKFPSKLFLADAPELEIVIVTSSKTEDVFANGIDDDMTLF